MDIGSISPTIPKVYTAFHLLGDLGNMSSRAEGRPCMTVVTFEFCK